METERFENRTPSRQTMADIFQGRWTSDLGSVAGVQGTGSANLFQDARVEMAVKAFGRDGRLDGQHVLELGPHEGGHTYQLEQSGAGEIFSVEADTDAFLRCLVVKELLGLSSKFFLGDAVSFLKNNNQHFDLIFCCGILYHVPDPLELIKQICIHSNRCFVWSHYYNPAQPHLGGSRKAISAMKNGFETRYYRQPHAMAPSVQASPGLQPSGSWMEKAEILRAFAHFGMSHSEILADQVDAVAGGHFSGVFSRA